MRKSAHVKGQGKLPYSHDNREGGIENIKVKHDFNESEHEMPKFKIFLTKMKKMKCKIVNLSNCEGLIGKVLWKERMK